MILLLVYFNLFVREQVLVKCFSSNVKVLTFWKIHPFFIILYIWIKSDLLDHKYYIALCNTILTVIVNHSWFLSDLVKGFTWHIFRIHHSFCPHHSGFYFSNGTGGEWFLSKGYSILTGGEFSKFKMSQNLVYASSPLALAKKIFANAPNLIS